MSGVTCGIDSNTPGSLTLYSVHPDDTPFNEAWEMRSFLMQVGCGHRHRLPHYDHVHAADASCLTLAPAARCARGYDCRRFLRAPHHHKPAQREYIPSPKHHLVASTSVPSQSPPHRPPGRTLHACLQPNARDNHHELHAGERRASKADLLANEPHSCFVRK